MLQYRGGPLIASIGRSRIVKSTVLALALVLTPLAAGLIAITVAPAVQIKDVGLDGLNVAVRVVPGRTDTQIDSALLGGLRTKAPSILGKPIGVDIRPSDLNLTLFNAKGGLDPTTIDVVGHLFGDPQAQRAEFNRIAGSVIRYYGTIFSVTVYLVLVVEVLGWVYLRRRRQALRTVRGRQRAFLDTEFRVIRGVASATSLALVVPAVFVLSPAADRTVPTHPDPALANTFLSGWQLTGPFTYLIRQAATTVDSLGKSEQQFYDQVSANRDKAYQAFYGGSELPRNDDYLRIAVLDDLQGTSGMARIVGEAAQRVHANAILNLGDMTATGTTQEAYLSYLKSYTVQVLAHYAGDIPVFSSLGRHDTPTVVSYAKKVHISVANGAVQKVAGMPMIGANSPYIVNFGDAARLKDPAITTDTVAAGLRDIACQEHPFAVFAHDKELLDPVINSGCVPLVIGGHSYDGEPSKNVSTPSGTVRKIILGSTGGHGSGDGIGGLTTPRNNAPFDIISIDRKTGEVHVDTTTVHPDATVTVDQTTLEPLDGKQRALLG